MNLLAEPRRIDFLRVAQTGGTSPRPLVLFIIVLTVVGAGVLTPSHPVVLIPPGPLTLAALERAFLSPDSVQLSLALKDPAVPGGVAYAFEPVVQPRGTRTPRQYRETIRSSGAAPVVVTDASTYRQQLYAARVLGAVVELNGARPALAVATPCISVELMTAQGHVIATGGFPTQHPGPKLQRLLNVIEKRQLSLAAQHGSPAVTVTGPKLKAP